MNVLKAAIAGVYTCSPDGEEYVTKNGNPYLKVLFVDAELEHGKKIYQSFFFTPKAHFRAEQLFAAVDANCPSAEDISSAHFKALISGKLEIVIEKNKAGYDTITKFNSLKPKMVEPIEPSVTDEISGQLDDDEEEDEIPF